MTLPKAWLQPYAVQATLSRDQEVCREELFSWSPQESFLPGLEGWLPRVVRETGRQTRMRNWRRSDLARALGKHLVQTLACRYSARDLEATKRLLHPCVELVTEAALQACAISIILVTSKRPPYGSGLFVVPGGGALPAGGGGAVTGRTD